MVELEPLPPSQPLAGDQLATPFGVQLSGNGEVLVATAAASSRIFTMDTATNTVLGRLDVGAIPRGLALASDGAGAPQTAYVLNTLESTVSVVDVSAPANPTESARWNLLADASSAAIRQGRVAFNSAAASSTGTFACASCHPDGNVDQFLWVIGAQCTFAGCDQQELRSTMPVRGLEDTLPLHWDGALGDPIGGPNGEIVCEFQFLNDCGQTIPTPANCTDEHDCFRHLVNAAIAGVMCDQGNCTTTANELGLLGQLNEAERDDMAEFLKSVTYPPARSRPSDDVVSPSALAGFEQFFTDVGGNIALGPETCADAPGGCHALPHGTGTNSPFVGAMDAPTMRGITDRFLIFSAGVTLVEEQMALNQTDVPWDPAGVGFDELMSWAQAFGTAAQPQAFRAVYNADPFDVFQMTEEAATGHSGALGRQVTLNSRTSNDAGLLAEIEATLDVLEAADDDGKVVLKTRGLRAGATANLDWNGTNYTNGNLTLSRAAIIAEAQAATTLLTFTARLPAGVNSSVAQPALTVPPVSTVSPLFDARPDLPELPGDNPMDLGGLHIEANPTIFVDGQVAAGSVTCIGGSFSPTCTTEQVRVTLTSPPVSSGIHLLQLQNPKGLISNELPIIVP